MIFYTDQGDTPIFCTSKDELGFVRGRVVGERENPMMKVRWRVFSLFSQMPEEWRTSVFPCGKLMCQSSCFPQED